MKTGNHSPSVYRVLMELIIMFILDIQLRQFMSSKNSCHLVSNRPLN